MQADALNLWNILLAGKAVWTLCLGSLFCVLIDSLWPRRMGLVVYAVGIAALVAAFGLSFEQWMNAESVAGQDLLVMDRLTVFLLTIVIFVAGLTLLNALGYLRLHQTLSGEFVALVLFAVVGMVFLVASDHLVMSFIGLETLSLPIYVLVGSAKKDLKSNEAAVKYFVLGGTASAVMLYGIVLFYGGFGTFRLSELANSLWADDLRFLRGISLALLLSGLFFKMAVAPFHFWAPDVYQGAPSPVTGFMATGVKAAAFGLALRIFMQLDVLSSGRVADLLAVIVVLTLAIGALAALVQDDVKRLLAYSSVSHAGFLLFGILAGFRDGVFDPSGTDAVIFYLFGYFFMTLGAFAVLSLLVREKGEATALSDLRGLGKRHPILAGAFALFMLSLMGLPATVGFAAKYGVVSLAVRNGHVALAVLAVVVSVISAFYYLKPVAIMFFSDAPQDDVVGEIPLTLYFSITFCAVAVVYLGLRPDAYLKLAKIAVSVWH